MLVQNGQEDPRASFHIKLLHACPVMLNFEANCVDISLLESSAGWTSVGLSHVRKAIIDLVVNVESLTRPEVLPLKRTTDYVNDFLFLSDAKVNSVVHHLTNFVELPASDVEGEDVLGRLVNCPVKVICLVASNDKNVLLVDDNNFTLGDLSVINFEIVPLHLIKIIESMLVEFGKVEHLVLEGGLSCQLGLETGVCLLESGNFVLKK